MRPMKWLLLVTLAAAVGACASPLDEPVGVSEADLYDLPGCDALGVADLAEATVLPAGEAGLYAVSTPAGPRCIDDVDGLARLGQRAHLGATPFQGTPLPSGPHDDGAQGGGKQDWVPRGTPLPAGK
jgi:hypothetical protein